MHQSYALASPQSPKNPYTNLAWSLGQIIHIVDSIQRCFLLAHHRFIDPWIIAYRLNEYDNEKFLDANFRALQILAAGIFFSDPHNLFFESLYSETVDDLFDLVGCSRNNKIYRSVRKRTDSLSESLMREWDDHVTIAFIYTNHELLLSERYKTMHCFEIAVTKTYYETAKHLQLLQPQPQSQQQQQPQPQSLPQSLPQSQQQPQQQQESYQEPVDMDIE
jgi:hypothetical protein